MHVDYDFPIIEHIPKSYDFSFPEEAKKFKRDYYMNCLFCLLKKHVQYFKSKLGNEFYKVEERSL